HPPLHAFPTRRSSDLACGDETSDGSEDPYPIEKCLDLCDHVFLEQYCGVSRIDITNGRPHNIEIAGTRYTKTSCGEGCASGEIPDRKSTRLNSSHVKI